MTVIADTSPLQYAVEIDVAPTLFMLYGRIVVPLAVSGIGVSLAIGMLYMGIGPLFEKLGDVSQLPPAMAAWAPNIIFSLAGIYFLLRMRS